MDLFFVDDAQQRKPSRAGMGPLLAIGGMCVSEQSLQQLEKQIEALCGGYGFSADEIFKWSPGRELWMHKNLVDRRRKDFFRGVLDLAKNNGATATVVIEDTTCSTATGADSPEIDVLQLFLERAHNQLVARQCNGVVIVCQPDGNRKSENKFLASCIETLKYGTDYVQPDKIVCVLCSPPKYIRLLQVADLITSCTTAFVSGESSFSPPVFDMVKPMLVSELGRIGGIGLKLHLDFKYVNLYHWLVGDSHFWRFMTGIPMPLVDRPYHSDPYTP